MSEPLIITDDISIIEGNKNELVLFAKNSDTMSFQKLIELNGQSNSRTLVTLNAVTNTNKFLNRFQYFEGKIFLCLEGNRTGDSVTLKILMDFKEKNIKDIRKMYEISGSGNTDLSQYLENKLNDLHKNSNLVISKESENAAITIRHNGISDTQHLGSEFSGRDSEKTLQESQSEQDGNNDRGQNVGGSNAGNGPSGADRSDLTVGESGRRSADGIQSQHAEEKPYLGRIIFGRIAPITGRSDGRVPKINAYSADVVELEHLISKYKDQKLNNAQVAEVLSAACFISDDKEVMVKDGIVITDELKDICNQFKSGGVAKEGRGILDEYYTNGKIVEAVRNLIKDHFKNRKELRVLEPSVGTGNFLYAAKGLSSYINISAFEINETTAKIAKILHPEANINLRSFETEFIDEKGNKKDFSQQYDLVIGNPPYGEHRGLYKGLGEEPKLSKYEDYFVKRSLDVLKDDGVLAMILPSGWLNRKKDLEDAELLKAFRLPKGAFAGTQVGTDIIILKKSSQKSNRDISSYFEKNTENILGEI
ncbi:HsdM family class I SAM-dependent methyltransferase, partial [Epilithonimonas mollis]